MRGNTIDALNGQISKASSTSAPFDRFVRDLDVINPMQAIRQDINPKYILHSRRYLPDDTIITSAQTTAITIDPSVPNVMNENGNAPIPRAGIFKFILSNNQ